jgi:hypothetical protein
MKKSEHQFVVCVEQGEYLASLETRKIYERLPDAKAEAEGYLRVVDESGEDYLFPAAYFVAIEVPKALERKLLVTS